MSHTNDFIFTSNENHIQTYVVIFYVKKAIATDKYKRNNHNNAIQTYRNISPKPVVSYEW